MRTYELSFYPYFAAYLFMPFAWPLPMTSIKFHTAICLSATKINCRISIRSPNVSLFHKSWILLASARLNNNLLSNANNHLFYLQAADPENGDPPEISALQWRSARPSQWEGGPQGKRPIAIFSIREAANQRYHTHNLSANQNLRGTRGSLKRLRKVAWDSRWITVSKCNSTGKLWKRQSSGKMRGNVWDLGWYSDVIEVRHQL